MLNGTPRPDHGEGWTERVCPHCDAGWVGHQTDGDDWCPWCQTRLELETEMRRSELLNPPWLHTDHGNPRYDALNVTDGAVWDRTRGQRRDTDSIVAWVAQLARAVQDGVITDSEADTAMRKVADR